MTPVALSDEARDDLREAQAFYFAISPTLAARFALEVDRAVRLIAESPTSWPPIGRELRRCLLNRFPYALVYRATETQARVIAVAHTRRRARFWRGRR